jgi:hypothetical protein
VSPSHAELKARVRALAALCITSRWLKDAAIRPLYHRPDTQKWWLLTRTLLRHPSLAQHVKHICEPGWPESIASPRALSTIPADVLSYYNITLKARAASIPEHDRERLLEFLEDDALFSRSETAPQFSMLATLCPKLEALETTIGLHAPFHFLAPGSMPFLRSVEVSFWDTENGFSLAEVVPLLKAAPNLAAIELNSVDDEEDPDLGYVSDKVKRVEFGVSAISAGALATVLRAFPAMEVFMYEAGGNLIGDVQFNPGQAKDMLLGHYGRLEKVELNLTEAWDHWDLDGENDWEEWTEAETLDVVETFKRRGIEFKLQGPEYEE